MPLGLGFDDSLPCVRGQDYACSDVLGQPRSDVRIPSTIALGPQGHVSCGSP